MSVRNILDGTIKVGSGGDMPVEPEIPEDLEVKTVKASGNVMGSNLIATGTVLVGGTETNSVISNNAIKAKFIDGYVVNATETLRATKDLIIGSKEEVTTVNGGAITANSITVDSAHTSTLGVDDNIITPAITVGKLNLFAEDQVLNETMQFDFTDGSRAITSVQAKAEATYLSITQYLHLFQLTINNLTGMPTTLIEFSVTIPKILPTSNYTIHDAVSVLLADTMPVGCALTIKATKGESLVVTFSFNTALQNPSSLSARFLREMP